jgi:dihydroflavonol-4-reductase
MLTSVPPITRLFVTGATGVLGRYVIPVLLEAGYQIVAYARTIPDDTATPSTQSHNITWVEGSLTDVPAMAIAMAQCQACLHMAGLVSFSSSEKTLLYETNVTGTAHVVNAALQATTIQHFMHIGSVAAIPAQGISDTQTATRPAQFSSYYGYTKRLSELETERGAAEGLGISIFRPSVVIGSHPSSRSSSSVLRLAARPGTTACPPGWLNWIAAPDVAAVLLAALALDPEGKTYILNSTPLHWHTFFTAYREANNIQGSVIALPPAAIRLFGGLAPLASLVTGIPIPERKQLLALLEPPSYPSSAPAQALIGRDFYTLAQTISWLKESN